MTEIEEMKQRNTEAKKEEWLSCNGDENDRTCKQKKRGKLKINDCVSDK